MRVHLLGTGSPNPLPERQGSAVLLSHAGEHLLVDAGRGATTRLVQAGVQPQELAAVLLTHHHYDHIGGLGDLLLTAWHGGAAELPLVGPPGTAEIAGALLGTVYRREVAFSHALARAYGGSMPDIQAAVPCVEIEGGGSYRRGAWSVAAADVDHGHALGIDRADWPCLAYRAEAGGVSVVVSGDTVACAGLAQLARGADALVQCCFLADAELTTPARRLLADAVIATSGQAGRIAAEAGVRTLILTHIGSTSPEMLAAIAADVRRDFGGELIVGEDLLAVEVAPRADSGPLS